MCVSLECSEAQFLSLAQHVVHAAERMQQPRRRNRQPFPDEVRIANELRAIVDGKAAWGLDSRPMQLLADAWQQLQRSGVLEMRQVEQQTARLTPPSSTFQAALQSSVSAPDRRTCALDGCGAREAHPAHFKSCAACRAVVYCCREHQVEGWPSHKKACKAARKAAAAEDADEAGPSGA